MDTKLFGSNQAGGMFSVVDKEFFPGSIFWVGSTVTGATDGAGYGQNPEAPVATIDYAIGLCTANAGDVIFVLPGHAENISSATGCVLDIAGVTIIGLGTGSLMPTLTLDTAAGATISITVANCRLKNLKLYSDFTNGVTAAITVGASADGLVLDGLVMEEAANTKEMLIGISVAAACNDVIVQNCRFYGVAGGTDSQWLIFVGASNNSVVRGNYIFGDFSGAAIDALTAKSLNMVLADNIIINVDTTAGLSISVKSDTTGFMSGNHIAQLKDTVGPAGAAMCYCENYVSNAVAVQGILKPAADS